MNKLFEELLSKETLSGNELGLGIIKNDILIYSGKTEDVMSQDIFDALVQKINNVDDAETLECYVQLQAFVQRSQAMANAFNQQAQNGCCRLMMYLSQSQQVEHARKMIADLPMIMTETQYRQMKSPDKAARRRGVAIVAESFPCRPKCLDENDHFINPEIDCFQEMMSLENIEKLRDKIDYFREDLLISGLKKHLAYNELYRLIGERIGMPEFEIFCVESDTVLEQVAQMNEQRISFEGELSGESRAHKNRKRILNDVFALINIDELYPSEESISKVRSMLEDISSFRYKLDTMAEILASDKE